MQHYLFVALAVFLFENLPGIYGLSCYQCTVVLQSGEDCSYVKDGQLGQCQYGQDICIITSVLTAGAKTPTINRSCGRTADQPTYPNQVGPALNPNQRGESCTTYTEGLRVSKLCQCNYDNCNSRSISDLNAINSASQSTIGNVLILALSTFFMLTLAKFVF